MSDMDIVEFVSMNHVIKDRQVADLDVTDLMFLGPSIPFCTADALWGGCLLLVAVFLGKSTKSSKSPVL